MPLFGRSYRFKLGTDVLCRTGEFEWSHGKIVAFDYRDDRWPPGKIVPYQVQLTNGDLIFVPADVEQLCKEYVPPAWITAVKNQDVKELAMAVQKGGVDAVEHTGRTALMACFSKGWEEGVRFLLEQGANPSAIAGSDKYSAIHLAVTPLSELEFADSDGDRVSFCRLDGVVKAKLMKPDEPDLSFDDDGVTEISYDATKMKLTWITDPAEGESWSVLKSADSERVPAMLAAVVKGTEVRTRGLPAASSAVPLLESLLDAGADVNAQDEDPENDIDNYTSTTFTGLEQRQHRSALHYAAEFGDASLCTALLKARATVDLEDRYKMTALDLALAEARDSREVVEVLLSHGADPNRGNMRRGLQQSALHQVCDSGDAEMVRVFVAHGINVNGAGKQGMTALHLAARKKHAKVVKVLLEAGADVYACDNHGRTPGQYASTNQSTGLAKALSVNEKLEIKERLSLLDDLEMGAQKEREEEQKRAALLKELFVE